MFFSKFFKSKRKHQAMEAPIQKWMDAQGHLDDALTYLIEKELFEHGERDLSYVIPRKRNNAYFEGLLDRESYEARFHSNIDMYDSIASIHPEQHQDQPRAAVPKKVTQARPTVQPNNSLAKNSVPLSRATKGKSISSVNKSKDIYNKTSSAVVVTPQDEQFEHDGVDMTCFED